MQWRTLASAIKKIKHDEGADSDGCSTQGALGTGVIKGHRSQGVTQRHGEEEA